jgi:hypothetical protein
MDDTAKTLTIFLAIFTAVFVGIGAITIIEADVPRAFGAIMIAVVFGVTTIYLLLIEIKDQILEALAKKP